MNVLYLSSLILKAVTCEVDLRERCGVHSIPCRERLGWKSVGVTSTHSQPLSSSRQSLCHEVTNTLASGRGSMLADGGLEEELPVQGAKYPASLNPAQCFTSSLPAAVFCFLSNCVISSSSSVLQEKDFFHENFFFVCTKPFYSPTNDIY